MPREPFQFTATQNLLQKTLMVQNRFAFLFKTGPFLLPHVNSSRSMKKSIPTEKKSSFSNPLVFLKKTVLLGSLLVCGIVYLSCSSAPKTPAENRTVRNEAGRLVQLGTKALREGQIAAARGYYEEAYRLFTSVDDPEGRIRALDGLGRVYPDKNEYWDRALTIAQFSGDPELIALALLLRAERQLLSQESSLAEIPQEGENLATELRNCINLLQRRPMDKARALRLYGALLRSTGQYDEALKAFNEAASIDQKEKAYIELASDNYLIASVYSKKGIYNKAQEYLFIALSYDKRAENSAGIGNTYYALGLVSEKAGNIEAARTYYEWARAVYEAIKMQDQAEAIQKRLGPLEK